MKKKKEIEEKVLSYVEKHRMLAAGDHVLCGLSGGADSVCLLYLLLAMKKHIPITITAVHVNHRLREEADADEAFAKELCSKLGLPFYREEADVKALAKAEGMTLEEAGRMARYQIFAQLASKLKATKIAVAHHANDQAETLLFHLCRGSGLTGLVGMRPVREQIIRPLLCLKREEIEVYLQTAGQSYVTDVTNADSTFARNALRNQVIPVLEEKVSSRSVEHMGQMAEIAGLACDYLEDCLQRELERCTKSEEGDNGGCLRLILPAFDTLHPYMKGQVLLACLAEMSGSRKDLANIHVQALLSLCEKQVGSSLDLPYQIMAYRSYDSICFVKKGQKQTAFFEREISITEGAESRIDLPDGQKLLIRLREAPQAGNSMENIPRKAYTKWIDYDKIDGSLVIRSPQAEDFFYFNDKNRKFVKDYMVNEKIPKADREKQLLLADGSHMVYFLGRRISNYYKVTEDTRHILEITVTGG